MIRAVAIAALSLPPPLFGAPPAIVDADADGALPEVAPAGAAAKLASADGALRALDASREAMRRTLAEQELARVQDGGRARRLAREILVAELRGHARASTPRELVESATMRSALRRVAARTLREHASSEERTRKTRESLAALDLDEARLRGDRAVAEAELRIEQEEARRRREVFAHIFDRDTAERLEVTPRADGSSHAHIHVAEAGTDDDEPERGFAARKGTLPLPVQRKCKIKSGKRDEYGGAFVSIVSPKNTNVRAVGAGTIVFADELVPYGKLVVLDHGQSYFSVYGGLAEIGVGTGARVRENGVVGQLAADTTLVFQIRSGSRTLTPSLWFTQRRRRATGEGAPP